MELRKATAGDITALKQLYCDTIVSINARDYDALQIKAWASTADRTASLLKRIEEEYFYVALSGNTITGFASLDDSGYLDMLYVHRDFQRMGVASLLLQQLLQTAAQLNLKVIETEASITAKPFFEKNGFNLTTVQTVHINDIGLTNYKMKLVLP